MINFYYSFKKQETEEMVVRLEHRNELIEIEKELNRILRKHWQEEVEDIGDQENSFPSCCTRQAPNIN